MFSGSCNDHEVRFKNDLFHFSQHQLNGDAEEDTCAICGNTGHIPTINTSGKKWLLPDPCPFAGNALNASKLRTIESSSPIANFPVKCTECNKLVWRFDLQNHHTRKHGNKPCPAVGILSAAEKSIFARKKKAPAVANSLF